MGWALHVYHASLLIANVKRNDQNCKNAQILHDSWATHTTHIPAIVLSSSVTLPTQGLYLMTNLHSFLLIIMEEAESFGQK